MTREWRTVAIGISLHAAVASGQSPAFRAETRLVVIPATVTNSRGELVTNLDQGAFTIRENGKRQSIALFRRDDVPISLGLLIDNSGSMRLLRAKAEAAALAFVRASNPDDEMFVINFADKARLDVPMTSDLRVLEAGIGRVDSIGGTALRDAIELAERYLTEHAQRERHILLIITDGNDNASLTSADHLRQVAERSGTMIEAIGLFAEHNTKTDAPRHELTELTVRTGGTAYFPTSIELVADTAVNLARQIRNQYTIAYAPIDQRLDSSYRRVQVEVAGPEPYVVHARAGYRANPPAFGGAR